MDRQAYRSHLPKFIISKGRNAPRGLGKEQIQAGWIFVFENPSALVPAASQPIFVTCSSSSSSSEVSWSWGDGLTSRRHQGDGGREGEFVLWAAILGPNGYRILEFFRLLRLGCLNQDVSTSRVQNLSPLQHKRLSWRRTDRLISSTALWPRASIISLSTSLAVDLLQETPRANSPTMSLELAKHSLGHHTKHDT